MLRKFLSVTLATLFATIAIAAPTGQQITIKDSKGATRAQFTVQGPTDVELSVVNEKGKPAPDSTLTLQDTKTKNTLTEKSVNGKVTFKKVTPGTWVLTSNDPKVALLDIGIAGGAVGAATVAGAAGGAAAVTGASAVGAGVIGGSTLTLGTVATGVAVAGAATATAVAVREAGSNNDTPISPAS